MTVWLRDSPDLTPSWWAPDGFGHWHCHASDHSEKRQFPILCHVPPLWKSSVGTKSRCRGNKVMSQLESLFGLSIATQYRATPGKGKRDSFSHLSWTKIAICDKLWPFHSHTDGYFPLSRSDCTWWCERAAPPLCSWKSSSYSTGIAAAEVCLHPTDPAVISGTGNKNLNVSSPEAITWTIKFILPGRCRTVVGGCPEQTQIHTESTVALLNFIM